MKKNIGGKLQQKAKVNQPATNNMQVSNEQYLKRSLRLLGVTSQQYLKQTKCNLSSQIFPKNILSPSSSKQFFFISLICIKNLVNSEDYQNLRMWYQPKNVNEQIQFKKIFFKLVQKLESQNLLPKNTILGKSVIMGQSPANSIIQFFRILSQLSLRALYIQKYSKDQRLIQLMVNPLVESDNDLNRFYLYPFVATQTVGQSPMKSVDEIERLKKIYCIYIDKYRKKILSLRTVEESEQDLIILSLLWLSQLSKSKSVKLWPPDQNRAFDRRVILDKNKQIWKQIFGFQCNYIDTSNAQILRNQGQISKILQTWKPITGTTSLIEFNKNSQKLVEIKVKCQKMVKQFQNLKIKITNMMRQ